MGEEIKVVNEKHYRLVKPEDLSHEDLELYKRISTTSDN